MWSTASLTAVGHVSSHCVRAYNVWVEAHIQTDSKTITVLVVDDHPPFAQGFSHLLDEQTDMTSVGIATNGVEAVSLARQLKPDVVVMDISMPEMNGIEATRAIKLELPNTAVLVLSAYGYHPYVVSALDAGAGGYLLKTAPMRDLVNAIRALQAGEAVLERSIAEKLLRSLPGSKRKSGGSTWILTDREATVLRHSLDGASNREIGERMGLSERTIQAYFTAIFTKMGVGSRLEAVLAALKEGWITLDDLP